MMGQEISLFFLFLGVLGFVSFIFILCVLGWFFYVCYISIEGNIYFINNFVCYIDCIVLSVVDLMHIWNLIFWVQVILCFIVVYEGSWIVLFCEFYEFWFYRDFL